MYDSRARMDTMNKSKITDYSLAQFLTMTVEITYRNHEKMYSVSVPGRGNKVRGKTLDHSEKEALYNKLASAN